MILRDAIERDGFAIIPKLLSQGEIEQILEEIRAGRSSSEPSRCASRTKLEPGFSSR
jgi:hypothetical protein